MDGNYKTYDWTASAKRIDEILNQPAGQFEEKDSLPSRDKLTYTNGFYANCTALFIDIRDSSKLPGKHKRPALAKIYRAFISEMVAVLNSDQYVREVSIVGDCVWAVYDTPKKTDINDVYRVAFTANTLIELLNARYEKRNIDPLKIGIGIDWGRALMIKAGYNGSSINDVIYMATSSTEQPTSPTKPAGAYGETPATPSGSAATSGATSTTTIRAFSPAHTTPNSATSIQVTSSTRP